MHNAITTDSAADWTAERVRQTLMLRPFDELRAARPGNDVRRQTGRTTEMLCEATAWLLSGRRPTIVGAHIHQSGYLARRCEEMVYRCRAGGLAGPISRAAPDLVAAGAVPPGRPVVCVVMSPDLMRRLRDGHVHGEICYFVDHFVHDEAIHEVLNNPFAMPRSEDADAPTYLAQRALADPWASVYRGKNGQWSCCTQGRRHVAVTPNMAIISAWARRQTGPTLRDRATP